MSRETKNEAQYKAMSDNSQQTCGLCSMFTRYNRHDGECSKVEGVVAIEGWCNYFERRDEASGEPGADIKFAKVKQI
jgi:hypothetical protein